MPRRSSAFACALAATAALSACGSLQRTDSLLGALTPYRIDIVQGNAITKEQAALIRPGMTRLQVRDVLGTPLLTDPFHAQTWEYIFALRRAGAEPQRRVVQVSFDGDIVKSITAPELPSEREFVASISRFKNLREPKLELTEDERKALPMPERKPVPPPEPMGSVRDYPPLENS